MGHYPDFRNKKGVEPEGLEVATFGDDQYIFVAEERSSLIAVYKDTGAEPEYVQTLPSGISPEGLVAIPSRNLLATANEVDLREDGLGGSHVMLYELAEGEAAYPQIVSDARRRRPSDRLGRAFGRRRRCRKAGHALCRQRQRALRRAGDLHDRRDRQAGPHRQEDRHHPQWRAGAEARPRRHHAGWRRRLLAGLGRRHRQADAACAATTSMPTARSRTRSLIPAALLAGEIRSGSEGIARSATTLWIAIQREWKDDEKGLVKLRRLQHRHRGMGRRALPARSRAGRWLGRPLAKSPSHGDYAYIVERDNQIAGKAGLKAIYRVPVSELVPAALGGELPVVSKELVRDLVPDLKANNGYVVDKVESFAIDAAGTGYVITDNDGVDDSSGETFFWSIGKVNN